MTAGTSLTSRRRVIVDTDPGIDDAMALLFLKARPDVSIEAVTTVFGNGGVGATTRNAAYLLDRFDMQVPLHMGADMPLTMPRRQLATHVHGADGMGDTGLATSFRAAVAQGAAAEAIIRLVRAHPGQLSLLALGPLTNLALALELDPGIAQLVRDVTVMGGSFGFGARRGNVTPCAEANIANDPHAADLVMGADWRVTMVGLDVTSHCVLPSWRARRIADEGGDAGRFLWDISRDYEQLYRDHDGIDGCCIHDVVAAMRLVEPDLFETLAGPVRVVTDGIAIGETIQKPDSQRFPPSAWDAHPSQSVCRTVDVERLLDLYEAALTGLTADAGSVELSR